MLSVTSLSLYLYCPRKLFLEKVLKLAEPPKESLVLGTVRHAIYDAINKREETLVSSITKETDIKELYKTKYLNIAREKIIVHKAELAEVNLDIVEVFNNIKKYILFEANERANHIIRFIQKTNLYEKELWEQVTPKIISEIKIESKELGLRGIVDRVESYQTGYVPIELKTGKTPKEGMWPGHRIQIIAYMILLNEHFNQEIKEGFVHYLDTNEKRHIGMNPFIKEEIIALVKEVNELLQRKTIPNILENQNKCMHCGLREKCYDQKQVQTMLTGAISENTSFQKI